VNHLERFTEKTLREVLYDHSKPFSCHYGAVTGITYLGSEVSTIYSQKLIIFPFSAYAKVFITLV